MTGPLKPNDFIGDRYEIESFIGAGGMQFVYKAKDIITGRHVALKTPQNNSATKRFRKSALVAARINHPNVAKTFDYLKIDNNRYLIEELIEGKDLSQALLRHTSFLDPALVAKILHHLSKGISAAHRAGVIHRDLKPSNIMATGGYSLADIKITDFGIARLAEGEFEEAAKGENSFSASRTAVGALPYMAPEMIEEPSKATQAADIWSLGAMMHHLLCGEYPFGAGLKAVSKIVTGDRKPAPEFLTSNAQFRPLALELLNVIESCLQVDSSKRPNAQQLVSICSDLCYSAATRRIGTIKTIRHRAWGFIESDDGDVFFHLASCYGPEKPKKGDTVVFSSFDGGGAPRAYPVLKVAPIDNGDLLNDNQQASVLS